VKPKVVEKSRSLAILCKKGHACPTMLTTKCDP
jgi:hypothetical protein